VGQTQYPHHFEKPDPDLHQSEMLGGIRITNKKRIRIRIKVKIQNLYKLNMESWRALDAHNGDVEAYNAAVEVCNCRSHHVCE
jgi:hypothetical protein